MIWVDRSMSRAVGAMAGLTLSLGLFALPPAPAAHADPEPAATDDAALDIAIDELAPSVLPRRGPLVVSGTVTNEDDVTWRRIALYPMLNKDSCVQDGTCKGPMTTAADLAAGAASEPDALVGERITDLTVSTSIDKLGPAESATFTITIPQRILRREIRDPQAGVYWFGVHASGESRTSPRDLLADGRARTFLPYVPEGRSAPTDSVDTAVVVPLRAGIRHTANGSLAQVSTWRHRLAPVGELGAPLAFGGAAGGRPVSWLVDPAVLDAVQQIADGNPARRLTVVDPAEPEPEPSDDASETTTSEPENGTADGEGGIDDALRAHATAAQDWLDRLRPLVSRGELLLLPYGDPDLAAAHIPMPDLYESARKEKSDVLADWGVAGEHVVAGADGYLTAAAIAGLDDNATVILGDRAFSAAASTEAGADPAADTGSADSSDTGSADSSDTGSADGRAASVGRFAADPSAPGTDDGGSSDTPATGRIDDHPVVVTSSAAATGGPGPEPRLGPIALRQRVLAEAAVRLIAPRSKDADPQPLVVLVPPTVSAEAADTFWDGLDVPWLSLTTTDDILTDGSRAEIDPARLGYPERQADDEVPEVVFTDSARLEQAGTTLQNVVTNDSTVGQIVRREALVATSIELRGDHRVSADLTKSRAWIDQRLRSIDISAPLAVTLSSSSGRFSVTIHNKLDIAVTVQVTATADRGVSVDPSGLIQIAPGKRTSVPLVAHTTRVGVHNVRLTLTDVDGNDLGRYDVVPIRSGQAGIVIWGVMGAGLAILFVAIGIRVVRRVRSRA